MRSHLITTLIANLTTVVKAHDTCENGKQALQDMVQWLHQQRPHQTHIQLTGDVVEVIQKTLEKYGLTVGHLFQYFDDVNDELYLDFAVTWPEKAKDYSKLVMAALGWRRGMLQPEFADFLGRVKTFPGIDHHLQTIPRQGTAVPVAARISINETLIAHGFEPLWDIITLEEIYARFDDAPLPDKDSKNVNSERQLVLSSITQILVWGGYLDFESLIGFYKLKTASEKEAYSEYLLAAGVIRRQQKVKSMYSLLTAVNSLGIVNEHVNKAAAEYLKILAEETGPTMYHDDPETIEVLKVIREVAPGTLPDGTFIKNPLSATPLKSPDGTDTGLFRFIRLSVAPVTLEPGIYGSPDLDAAGCGDLLGKVRTVSFDRLATMLTMEDLKLNDVNAICVEMPYVPLFAPTARKKLQSRIEDLARDYPVIFLEEAMEHTDNMYGQVLTLADKHLGIEIRLKRIRRLNTGGRNTRAFHYNPQTN